MQNTFATFQKVLLMTFAYETSRLETWGGKKLNSSIIGASVALWVVNLQGCAANNCLLYLTSLSFNRTLLMPVEFSQTPPLYVFR